MAAVSDKKAAKAEKNGKVKGLKTIDVFAPATGKLIGTIEKRSPADVAELVARARAVQPMWEAMGFDGRARVLRRAQKWVLDNSDRVVETIVSETGKTHEDALFAEVTYAANAFGFWAKTAPEYLADEHVRSSNPFLAGRKLTIRYRPVGVVGVIGPWNFPLTNSFGDCIPALAAGNATILKPSQVTPFTSLLMAEMLAECGLPENVYQVATGDSETAEALIDGVDYVMFTGSTEVGKKVMARAAKTLTPVGLELGGKDPMVVLADADVERAAQSAAFCSMNNGGQICISVERVYVEEPIYDEFVQRVAEKVKDLRQGVPSGPGSVDVGAIINPPQIDLIERHVEDAVKKGARVLTGGHRLHGSGAFFEPTVLVDVDHTMECMTEETFGPTLPIMKVKNAEEAVRLANDSLYGLQASIWTKDTARAESIAKQIEAGVCCVNDAQINYVALEVPMGGWKESGLGARHGAGGIRKYTRQQTLLVRRIGLKRDLHMFPYKERRTKLLTKALHALYGRGKR